MAGGHWAQRRGGGSFKLEREGGFLSSGMWKSHCSYKEGGSGSQKPLAFHAQAG